ncbi:MAG: tyrosine-type recombinase/integrase [Rhodococcus sp. (in: high G+C Gram-positive bacteria)]|uniref:tyrosine-type recombinase/integrase n=1 Tax=Rhodococcus sp. TaxID=1831 RepID=UPI002AD6086E|nr:tyrosine-type recombinase/integrase [Rhodococcus sp. (in: high G+C Gram-positive bacteria)]
MHLPGYRWRAAHKSIGAEHRHQHHLRHTSTRPGLYIVAGCDVVTVQRALGHSSASATLNTYSRLCPFADDKTRRAADDLFRASAGSAADVLRTIDPK